MTSKITIVDSLAGLSGYQDRWQVLADCSSASNLFYEPMLFISAYKHLAIDVELIILFVEDTDSSELIGFFPLKVENSYRRLPIKHYSLWQHTHSVTAVPLLAKGREHQSLDSFFSWVTSRDCEFPLIRFPYFVASEKLRQKLLDKALEYQCEIDFIDNWDRALLSTQLGSSEYFSLHYSRKRRKEYKRLWKRLSDQGELEFYTGELGPEQVDDWLQSFLTLENSGWKSIQATSISSNRHEQAFFTEAVTHASNRKRLSVSWLSLDGDLIATECSFTGQTGCIMLKIAYNEDYAKYSPGVLLVLKKTEVLLDQNQTGSGSSVWYDSCAIPHHPMINHLWKQKLAVADFSVTNGRFSSYCIVVLIKLLVKIKRISSRRLRGANTYSA